MKIDTRKDEQFISVEELSDLIGWNPMTIFEKADSGKIPGAVWGETLRFEKKEIEAFLRRKSEIEETLKELEQEGFLKSFVGADGERRYILAKHLH